jgi:hypothetical protein
MVFNIKTAKLLTNILENEFRIANFKFGLDPIIGLVPVLGDLLGAGISLYLIGVALEHKLPKYRIFQMIFNILIDYLGGSIPLLGTIFDFAFKANSRNFQILKKYIKEESEILEGEILR